MRYLIKSQLIRLLKKLAYTAYGFDINLTNQQVPLILRSGQQKKLCYKFPISQMIYQQYRKDGFTYSDPGTTPKLIAEDILDHFKSLGHVQMESDQFGNILGYIKQKYFQQTFKEITGKQKISILNCQQYNHHMKKSQQTAGQPYNSVKPRLQQNKIINSYQQRFNLNQNSRAQNNYLKQNNRQSSEIQISKSSQNIKNLNIYINFTKNNTKLSLNQLRQKYYRDSLIKIDKDVFQGRSEQTQICQFTIQKNIDDFLNRISKNVSNICLNALCLRHQLIKSQTVVERIIKDYLTNKNMQQIQTKYLKLGIVNPQKLIYSQAQLGKICKLEKTKLKKIFLSVPAQYPVNLKDKNLSKTLSKQSQKFNQKLVKMYPGLNLSQQYLLAISKSQKLAQNHLNRILLIIYELIYQSDLPKLYSLYFHIQKFKNILQKSHTQNTNRFGSLQNLIIYAKIVENHLKLILLIE